MRFGTSHHPAWVRLVAMLFVCLIVADVTMDGACDGLAQSAAGGITITSGPFDGGSDAREASRPR
jgi:hypothetical protein